jgi:hexosaminidase
MSNSDALYLDCGFGHYVRKDISWCDPYKQWRTIYDNDPRSIYLAQDSSKPERAALVVGGEAPAWSESIGGESLETRVWPRGAALAERLWTRPMPAEDSWRAADMRLLLQRERMAQRGVAAEALQPLWCLHFDQRCVEE